MILAVLELPWAVFSVFSWLLLLLLPLSVYSAFVLFYLLRPRIAQIFELGLGPAILDEADANLVEGVL